LTGGESCDTNVKLIINNAKVGAGICKELFELMKEGK
jgi:pseudouridine-5'-phosphate glycosidase